MAKSMEGLFGEQRLTVAPPPMLGERVTNVLRRMIISGEIPVETHLVEAQLSETFGLSRGPVRDALRQLEREGLVESRRRGVFSLGLSTADVDELYELREALELKAMTLCATHSGEALTDARGLLGRMKDAAKADDHAAFTAADLDFHSAFYSASGNRRILGVWTQYRPTYQMMMDLATDEPIDLEPIYVKHEKLYEATVTGDIETLTVLLREHLLASKQRLVAAHTKLNAAN